MTMLEKLTDRAKEALLDVSGDKEGSTTVKKMIGSIMDSGGLGTFLLQNNPKIKLKDNVKVDLNELVEKAFYVSASLQHLYVGTEHLLIALLELVSSPDSEPLKKQIIKMNSFPNLSGLKEFDPGVPVIEAFGVNLNKKLAQYGKKTSVSRKEVDQLIKVLLKKENSNALIIGDPGVGKDALVELLVRKINSYDVPRVLVDCKVIEFDIMAFIANISTREGIEGGITAFLEDLDKVGNVILFIKDFQSLFIGTNAGFAIPLAFSLLRSYLSAARISIIGVMDAEFYEKVMGENPHILDDYETIELSEPEIAISKEILKSKVQEFTRFHNIRVSDKVVDYTLEVSKKIEDRNFPEKAVGLLDYASAVLLMKRDKISDSHRAAIESHAALKARLDQLLTAGSFKEASKIQAKLKVVQERLTKFSKSAPVGGSFVLTTTDIDEAMDELGYIPATRKVNIGDLSSLTDKIKKKIIGQDAAVEAVAKALIRAKLGLRAKKRPLGNFLFLGPTGVGKTELAKVLADKMFGEGRLIRLDMSDFSEKHNVARLVGSPPGYVGYGEGGELTSKIEEKPESVVLFDEIEKAHPDVLNILLQIMEEGELSDAKGTRYDFSKAVVILTSNLGTDIVLKDDIGFSKDRKSDETIEDRLRHNLKKIMKPELLNRFDETIVFKRLAKPDQRKILELLLLEVKNTLIKQDVRVKMPVLVKDLLLSKGYSDEYGARALRRTIETELLDRVAEVLLTHQERPLSLEARVKGTKIAITL